MKQHLIVEGKDYFFIGTLCRKHFGLPIGFTEKTKNQFLKGGGGFDQTLDTFLAAFDSADLTNIGLIVDADFGTIESRFAKIIVALSRKLNYDFSKYQLDTEGVFIDEIGLPTIGIWIMPDNTNSGYIEHFVENLIDENDDLLPIAKETIDNMMTQPYCRITGYKRQKAIIHSWLAWQETPGLPFGSALEAGYLKHEKDSLKSFLKWIEAVFQF
ncbi:MAG: hypothetical protein JNL70_04555 [Saprospiraceae bacterium]|nr:hypothetical protein [Saprospiraceae bacterium]